MGKGIVRLQTALLLVPLGLALGACEDDDVGEPCTAEIQAQPAEPIDGERAVLEVVSLSRDQACETFQCLRHQGLEPYCTEECRFTEESSDSPCEDDNGCSGDEYCEGGQCRKDDCPDGFWCRQIQETGPNVNKTFCTRRVCNDTQDCFAIGGYQCVTHGCYDACLRNDAGTQCDFNQRVCEPFSALADICQCQGGDVSCSDAELRCETETLRWNDVEAGGYDVPVERIGYCLPVGG